MKEIEEREVAEEGDEYGEDSFNARGERSVMPRGLFPGKFIFCLFKLSLSSLSLFSLLQ